ncbi:MAG: hypothetical protein ACJ0GH_02940 [Alphaproteobacteria bacterium]
MKKKAKNVITDNSKEKKLDNQKNKETVSPQKEAKNEDENKIKKRN